MIYTHDVAIIDKMIDLEYDGFYFHKDREKTDEERNLELKNLGWKVIRINKNDDMEMIVKGVLI